MNADRLDFNPLRMALQALQDGLAVVQDLAWFDQQDAKVRNTLIAGVIQSFEFVYEISIKMLRRQLEREADNPVDIDQAGFRDLLRIAPLLLEVLTPLPPGRDRADRIPATLSAVRLGRT